jgi:hypothetical protein
MKVVEICGERLDREAAQNISSPILRAAVEARLDLEEGIATTSPIACTCLPTRPGSNYGDHKDYSRHRVVPE